MNHWLLAPIILPALTAIFFLLTARSDRSMHRATSVLASLALVAVSAFLLHLASVEGRVVYSLGDWPVPFGIVVVLDRLSALMVLLTALVGLGSILYAIQGWDERGKNFHALLQFQLMGLNGAFLTGDIFNLFVFFEILLIASYGLLLHGGGLARVRAGLHYVVFNLTGSALFIIALGLIYGSLGTLNMADIATRIAALDPADVPLVRSAFLLLLVVFSIKAAALPLYFWLPAAYASASAPVASLFAIMTKVGLYAIVRVTTLMLGDAAGPLAGLAEPLMIGVGIATTIAAALGALAATDLRDLVSYLVIASVGSLFIAFGLPGAQATAAGVYYLVHSTAVMAGFFLLCEVIARNRGEVGSVLVPTAPTTNAGVLGTGFLLYAVAAAGLPPLSGFFGKFLILREAVDSDIAAPVFAVLLAGGLISLVALSRAGTVIFWKTDGQSAELEPQPTDSVSLIPIALHLAIAFGLVVGAAAMISYSLEVAAQLDDPQGYINAVFAHETVGRRQ